MQVPVVCSCNVGYRSMFPCRAPANMLLSPYDEVKSETTILDYISTQVKTKALDALLAHRAAALHWALADSASRRRLYMSLHRHSLER
jgi:hypothetical protein